MASAFQNNTSGLCDFPQELYLGGVEVWITELNDDGSWEGLRCMGCAEDATLSTEETKLEVDKACQGIRETTEIVTKRKQTLKFTVQNTTLQNIAEFLAGTVSSYANPAVAGVTQVVQVERVVDGGNQGAVLGRTILLRNATGQRIYDLDLADLVVEQSSDGSMWTALGNDDFTLDGALGSIYIIPTADGGDVVAGNAIRITVTADAAALSPIYQADALSQGRRFVGIRLLASNGTQDEAKGEVLAYSVFLSADGDLALSGTEIMKIGFTGTLATNDFYGTPLHVNNVPSAA